MTEHETAPVDVDEEHVVEIEDTGEEDDGVAHIEGFVVLVPEAEIGERVLVRIVEVSDDYAVADVVESESDVGS